MSATKQERILEKVKNMLNTTSEKGATEQEAQNALLNAQRLLAKHGLSMEDVEAVADEEQRKVEVDENYTDAVRTEWWQGRMAKVIADNFKCFYYMSKLYGGKQRIVFVGAKEDAEVAKMVYLFASSVLPHLAKKYLKERKKEAEANSGYNFKKMTDEDLYAMAGDELTDFELYELESKYKHDEKIYKMRLIMKLKEVLGLELNPSGIKNDYMTGFILGLDEQFREQVEQNKEEWGLVLVKDKEVVHYYENLNLRKGAASSAKRSGDAAARSAGFQQGKSWSAPRGGING
jgi:hypothetical protein